MKPVYIVDVMADVVSRVSAAILPALKLVNSSIEQVNYQYGHPVEIISTLQDWTNTKTYEPKRYPLIALFQDFPETKGNEPGIYSEVSLHFIIANLTQPTYKSAQRYENNFKPILYPVYDEFLKQVHQHPQIYSTGAESIRHEKIDRVFWGKQGINGNDANVFNDWLDCIELRDFRIKIHNKIC